MALITPIIALGPPIVGYVAYFLITRRRRKGSKKRTWKSFLKTIPISAVFSGWLTFVIKNPQYLRIPEEDIPLLQNVDTLSKTVLPVLPAELALPCLLFLLIMLVLSPF
jgi:hypothetical protein